MKVRDQLSAVVMAAAVLPPSGPAWACKCALVERARTIADTPVVFEGEILTTRPAGAGRQETTIRVVRAIRGVAAGAVVTVRTGTSAAACGWDFRQSARRLTVGGTPHGASGLMARRCTLYNLNRS